MKQYLKLQLSTDDAELKTDFQENLSFVSMRSGLVRVLFDLDSRLMMTYKLKLQIIDHTAFRYTHVSDL